MVEKNLTMDVKAVGARIRTLRVTSGMTQEKLAELANLSTPYISHLETGKKRAGVDTLIRISTALNTTFDFLLTGKYQPECNKSFKFQELLVDCTPKEVRIICEIAEASKKSIRENL